jgi:hypothetical protein
MPAQSFNHQQLKDVLIDVIAKQQHRLKTDFPQTWQYLKQHRSELTQNKYVQPSAETSVLQSVEQSLKPKQAQVSIEVTKEEHDQILGKLSALTNVPAGKIDLPDQLYFEQQLGDMLGMTISAQLDSYSLPDTIAHSLSLPHFKTHPTDKLSQHSLQEAGLSPTRPSFGWLTDKSSHLETFGIAIPLHKLDEWSSRRQEYLEWFKHRKVLVINPSRQLAAVGAIINSAPAHVQRFQVGLSPELVRATQAWHPETKGKLALFLVDEAAGNVPLGPASLKLEIKEDK